MASPTTAYHASKAAVLFQVSSIEWIRYNINVNAIGQVL